jgi:transposase-like protein
VKKSASSKKKSIKIRVSSNNIKSLQIWGDFFRLNRHFYVVISLSSPHNRGVYPLYFIFMNKKCPKCSSFSVIKDGKRYKKQSFCCKICGHVFQNKSRVRSEKDHQLFLDYSLHKQTLSELADIEKVSIRTIHRKLTSEFQKKIEISQENSNIRLSPNLSQYTSSVLILDATFFGRKGSDSQWWLLVAIDGITGDILASKHILQETKEDYEVLLHYLFRGGYPNPHFALIDGRNGVDTAIHKYYHSIPIQLCQAHKIATIDRYLLKYPRIESYKKLKEITHGMVHTDKATFLWQLKEFRNKYNEDFRKQELDMQTLKDKPVHPRLHLAYNSLIRSRDQLFVCLDFIQTIQRNHSSLKNSIINTSNRIEWIFSHLKPKVKIHRWLTKERRLSLALSLLWKDNSPT